MKVRWRRQDLNVVRVTMGGNVSLSFFVLLVIKRFDLTRRCITKRRSIALSDVTD